MTDANDYSRVQSCHREHSYVWHSIALNSADRSMVAQMHSLAEST